LPIYGNPLQVPRVTTDALQRGHEFYRRNKDLSLLITVGIYALNIIDANVDAHLMQYNIDENLTLTPNYQLNEFDGKSQTGLTLDRKSTRLNSSHVKISYAVFCLI